MEQTISFTPQGVCSRHIEVVVEDNIVKKVTFIGGCPGNTQGVSKLAVGHSVDELINLLEGVKCPGSRSKMTSCPDQLAKALHQVQK